jgi:hypothetical protein
MVVDYKLFTPRSALKKDTLWVSEQIPGLVARADVTQQLERGYWPSYNVPYFEEVYNRSGYPAVLAHFAAGGGPTGLEQLSGLKYQTAPRANIFRRDQGAVADLAGFKRLMRSNDYENDPYAGGDPDKAICIRGDLGARASDGGCLDSKVIGRAGVMAGGVAEAVNGPTRGSGPRKLPVFAWGSTPKGVSHVGLPEAFDFEFEAMVMTPLPAAGVAPVGAPNTAQPL